MTIIFEADTDGDFGALPVVDVLPEELALVSLESCRDWWRASEGFDGAAWLGRKEGLAMTPKGAVVPTLTEGGQNGRPYLLMAPSGNPGILSAPADLALIDPDADWSIAWAAHLPSGNAAYFGNAKSNPDPFFGAILGGGGRMDVFANGTANLLNSGTATFANQFLYAILSYKASPRLWTLRVNGVQRAVNTNAAQNIANKELCIGGAWSGTGNIWYSAWNGRFYDVMAFNAPLADAERAEDLASVEDYFRAAYAVS